LRYCDVLISSFYVEMRPAQHVKAQTNYIHVWTCASWLESWQNHEVAALKNSTGEKGRVEP
jgi:hypothetical protein